MTDKIDFTGATVIDAHCHGFTAGRLLAQEPEGFLDRVTVMGMCFESAKGANRALAKTVSSMSDSTLMAMVTRRRLAKLLRCAPEEVLKARHDALVEHPHAYVSRLMADAHIGGLLVDDGFPQPQVDQREMQELVGATIHRVARIEPMIEAAREGTKNAADLEDAFRALLEEAGDDSRCVAYKSIIAYRTGLDIGQPSREEVITSYQQWQASGWREGRDTSKALRDHLLNVTIETAKHYEKPVHIHSGAGDSDVILSHAHPANLAGLLHHHMDHPIVLIHSGYPWLEEAVYLASLYPLAYLELSLHLPWATLDIDRVLTQLIGNVPTDKILYGSDEASEPEIIWLSAKLVCESLRRALAQAITNDFLTAQEAEKIGLDILARNTQRLHRLA